MGSVSRLNYKIIFHLMGLLLLVNGGFMLIASIFSFVYKDGVGKEMVLAGLVTLTSGGVIMLLTRNHKKELDKRDGYIIVTFGWIFYVVCWDVTLYLHRCYSKFYQCFF